MEGTFFTFPRSHKKSHVKLREFLWCVKLQNLSTEVMHLFTSLVSFEVSHSNGLLAIMYIVVFVQINLGADFQRQMLSVGNLLH